MSKTLYENITEGVTGFETDGVKQTLIMLNNARKNVILQIAQLPDDRWAAHYLDSLKNSIDVQMSNFARDYQIGLNKWTEYGLDQGILFVDKEIMSKVVTGFPDMDRSLLKVTSSFSADKVVNITAQAKDMINNAVTLGVIGGKSQAQVISEIGRSLSEPSVFKTIGIRAEMITRTEINRTYSMAKSQRQKQIGGFIPGLQKRWIYNHFPGPTGRTGHMAMHGTTVPISDKFQVASMIGGPTEPMDHPHDPAASAGNVIGCRCGVKTVLPEDVKKKEKTVVIPKAKSKYQQGVLDKLEKKGKGKIKFPEPKNK